jgi:hypothetical protein
VTVTTAVPLTPSTVALIVAVPAATPVTTPVELTVAVAAALDAHNTVRPVTTAPVASSASARSATVRPTWMLAVAGTSRTCVTGRGETATGTTALLPPLLTAICVLPVATAVTTPFCDTVAMRGSCVAQYRRRSLRLLPFTATTRAVRVRVSPTTACSSGGLTSSRATSSESGARGSSHDTRPRHA